MNMDVDQSWDLNYLHGNIIMTPNMNYKHKHSVVGGTFDRMHKGHEALLADSFTKSEKVTIGISSNEFASERLKNNFEDYESRLKQIENYLRANNLQKRASVIRIEDIFGTTLTDTAIDSIIVTKETIEGAETINAERAKQGLEKLKVEIVPLVLGQNSRVIASTNIRLGLTNRQGHDYFLKIGANKYILPNEIRPQISKPQGKVITENDLRRFDYKNYSKVITVGDIVTKTFVEQGLRFDLAVVDFKTNKKMLFKSLDDLGIIKPNNLIVVKNTRGTISKSLTRAVRNTMVRNINGAVIQVIGEEDLAVIPTVILAPLSSLIFYGQRNEGIVCVEVTEGTKERFLKIIERFKKV